jgi:hypothetical protein
MTGSRLRTNFLRNWSLVMLQGMRSISSTPS